MNALIENLNLWGERFLHFAWPMLLQSSLLIAVLFALDFALRRKIRAVVRYTLWLVVLVKLLLPPTLALPTGVAWWVRPSPPPAKSEARQFIVTYGTAVTPVPPTAELPQPMASPSKVSLAVWAVAASVVVSFGLMTWMILRWRHVARVLRAASPATETLNKFLADGKRSIGLRRNVRLCLTDLSMSPALCGLFRPVILLPRALAEKLPPNQLRSVLLHELVHLKRGDVWVNCAQALLQIAYWWHPLLWAANVRIRRVREEAVDDAVMLALRDDAETYAPTLLEVAKLAFNRPLASLGLVGILESKCALRQRIERLMNFHPSRRAGLTFASILWILAFGALAVPMGEAPQLTEQPPFVKQVAANTAETDQFSRESADRESSESITQVWATPAERALLPTPNPYARTNRIPLSKGRQAIMNKLQSIRLESVSFDREPFGEVVRKLSVETKKSDPEKRGLNFMINPQFEAGTVTTNDTNTGLPGVAGPPDLMRLPISLNPPLTDVRLVDVLDAIVKAAPEPIRYSIEDYAVVFLLGKPSEPLYTRTFKLNTNVFYRGLENAGSVPINRTNAGPAVRNFFISLGVDLSPPKSVFYSDGKGMLLVRATLADLDTIESAIQVLNAETPQVNIKPEFAENAPPVHKSEAASLVQKGRLLIEVGQLAEAAIELKKAIAIDPENKAAHYYLSMAEQPALAVSKKLAESNRRSLPPPQEGSAPRNGGVPKRALAADGDSSTNLYVRTYKLDPNTFYKGLEGVSPHITRTNASAVARDFFATLGVELNPPKSVFFNDRAGTLLIRATIKELDTVDSAIQVLNTQSPQVNIKAKFVEVPIRDAKKLLAMFFTNAPVGGTNGFTGMLTEPQANRLMKAIESTAGAEIMGAPEATTLSGRQTQIQVVDVKTVINGINPQALVYPGISSTNGVNNSPYQIYQTAQLRFGPVLDVIPTVSADGYTINMTVIPNVTEFLGYDGNTNLVPVFVNGQKENVGLPLPKHRSRQMTVTANVWDGQTLVLGNFPDQVITRKPDGSEETKPNSDTKRKQLLVFVTPTIVDPKNKRVHSDEEMPFAREGVPPQTPR